jgi:hypothetical protein
LPLDPDPDSQYGSGSTKSLNPDPIRIRIHNPAGNCSQMIKYPPEEPVTLNKSIVWRKERKYELHESGHPHKGTIWPEEDYLPSITSKYYIRYLHFIHTLCSILEY